MQLYKCSIFYFQLEVEKSNLERKVKLLEEDLDKAEDSLAAVKSEKSDLEARVDDLERLVL